MSEERHEHRKTSGVPALIAAVFLALYGIWLILNVVRDLLSGSFLGALFNVVLCALPLLAVFGVRILFGRAESLGTALVIAWAGATAFFVHYAGTSQQQLVLIMGFGAMFILFILALVNRYISRGFVGKSELAIVYSMMLVAVPLSLVYRGALESGIRNLDEGYLGRATYSWVKKRPWLSPVSEDAVENFYEGPIRPVTFLQAVRSVVPWNEWLLPMLYWGALFALFMISTLAFVALWRRRWVDEEKLAFPWTQVPLQIIDAASAPDTAADGADLDGVLPLSVEEIDRNKAAARLARKAMVWGLAIGFLLTVPGLLPAIWEKFTVLPTSRFGVPPSPNSFGIDLTAFQFIEGVALFLSLDPFVLLSAFFLPLDFLLTVFIAFVGLNMLLPWFLAKVGMPGYAPRIYAYVYMVLRTGGLFGIPLWTLWFGRDHIKAVLTSLIGKTASSGSGGKITANIHFIVLAALWLCAALLVVFFGGPATVGRALFVLLLVLSAATVALLLRRAGNLPDETAQTEALACRTLIFLFLASAVFFIFLVRIGTNWQVALLTLAMIFFWNFTYARIRAEGAYPIYAPWHAMKSMAHWQKNLLVKWEPAGGGLAARPLGHWQTEEGWMGAVGVGTFAIVARSLGPQTFFAEPFKVGAEAGVHPRRIMRSILLAVFLVLFTAGPLYISFAYQYGNKNVSEDWRRYTRWDYYADTFGTRETPMAFAGRRYWFWTLLGVGLYGLLFWLRREMAGWPISPVAVFFAAVPLGYCDLNMRYIWFTLLVALALKYLAFRWYGVMNFRRRIQPAVAWALVGLVGGMILYMIVYSFRGEGVWRSPLDVALGWYSWLRSILPGG
ncbi:MAG TPA: hypothetical protein ENN09_01030 [Planctomycetes bacterium]|nr:hypothetical protein [Planctomycetota bacterium]